MKRSSLSHTTNKHLNDFCVICCFVFVFFTAIMVYRNSNRLYNSIKTSCHLPTAMTKFRLLMTNYCYADIYKPRLTLPFKSLGPVRYFYVFKEVLTLLKKKVPGRTKKGLSRRCHRGTIFGSLKNHFVKGWCHKEPFLVLQRTLFKSYSKNHWWMAPFPPDQYPHIYHTLIYFILYPVHNTKIQK